MSSARSRCTEPAVATLGPAAIRSRVDFPQPDGPTMATNSPGAAERHVVDGVRSVAEHLRDVLEGDGRRRLRIDGRAGDARRGHRLITPTRGSWSAASTAKWVWTMVSATSAPSMDHAAAPTRRRQRRPQPCSFAAAPVRRRRRPRRRREAPSATAGGGGSGVVGLGGRQVPGRHGEGGRLERIVASHRVERVPNVVAAGGQVDAGVEERPQSGAARAGSARPVAALQVEVGLRQRDTATPAAASCSAATPALNLGRPACPGSRNGSRPPAGNDRDGPPRRARCGRPSTLGVEGLVRVCRSMPRPAAPGR